MHLKKENYKVDFQLFLLYNYSFISYFDYFYIFNEVSSCFIRNLFISAYEIIMIFFYFSYLPSRVNLSCWFFRDQIFNLFWVLLVYDIFFIYSSYYLDYSISFWRPNKISFKDWFLKFSSYDLYFYAINLADISSFFYDIFLIYLYFYFMKML